MKQIITQLLVGSLLVTAYPLANAADAGSTKAADPIRFDIERFDVSGNTLLSQTLVDKVLTPFVGKSRDFADVQKALEALEAVFHQRGYNVVQVELPEQELNGGVVRLRVVQTTIGKIVVEGNRQFSDANITDSLPGLKVGQTPNIQKVSASLKVANENPAKKVNLQLESGDKDGEVNAILKVAEDRIWKGGVGLDNTGTSSTGKTHANFSLQNANLFGLDHVASLQYTTTLEKPSRVKVYGVGYHIPLYASANSIDLFGSYSNVDSGSVSAGLVNLLVSGKGKVFGARFNHNLERGKNHEPKLVYGLDYKAFENEVLYSGTQLGHDVTVHPLSVGYTGAWTLTNGELNYSLTLVRNISGGSKGHSSDFNATRIGASSNFLLMRYALNHTRQLPHDWQMRLAFTGQYTEDALIPGEQFGAGGDGSVRGFTEREVSNDYGQQFNAELYTPNFCSGIKMWPTQCRLLAFYDAAHLDRNKSLPGEVNRSTLSSTGLGLRMFVDRYLNVQLDYGHVLSGASGSERNRLHFKLNFSY
jgi:hemolysin activation/secretion protein